MFGSGCALGTTLGRQPYTQRVKQLKIYHLLEHTAGGWSEDIDDFDPLYEREGKNREKLEEKLAMSLQSSAEMNG